MVSFGSFGRRVVLSMILLHPMTTQLDWDLKSLEASQGLGRFATCFRSFLGGRSCCLNSVAMRGVLGRQ